MQACDPSGGRGVCGIGCVCMGTDSKKGICRSADSYMQPGSKQPLNPEEFQYYQYDQPPTKDPMAPRSTPGGVAGLLPGTSNTQGVAVRPGGGVTTTSQNLRPNNLPGLLPDTSGGTAPTTSHTPGSNVRSGGAPVAPASGVVGGGMPDVYGDGQFSMSYEDGVLSGAQGGVFSAMSSLPGGSMGAGAVPSVPAGGSIIGVPGVPGGAPSQTAGAVLSGGAYMPGSGMLGHRGSLGGLGAPGGSASYGYDYYGQSMTGGMGAVGGMSQMGGRTGSMGHQLLGALGSMMTGAAGSMYLMPGAGMGGIGSMYGMQGAGMLGAGMGGIGSMYGRHGVGMGGFGSTAMGNMQYGSYDYGGYTPGNQMSRPQQPPVGGQSQPSAAQKTPVVPSPNQLPPTVPPRSPQPSEITNKNLPSTPVSGSGKNNPGLAKLPTAAPISRPSVSPTPAPRHRTLPGGPPISPKPSSSSKYELPTFPSTVSGKGKPDIGKPDRPLPPRPLVRPLPRTPPPPAKRVSPNINTPHASIKPLQPRPLTKPLKTPSPPPKPSMIDVGGGKPPLYTQPIPFPRPNRKLPQQPVTHRNSPIKKVFTKIG